MTTQQATAAPIPFMPAPDTSTGRRRGSTKADATSGGGRLPPGVDSGRSALRPPKTDGPIRSGPSRSGPSPEPRNTRSTTRERRPDPLLDAEQAGQYLGTSTRFVRRLIAEHRIDYVKLGKYVRLQQSTLDAFIDAGRVSAS